MEQQLTTLWLALEGYQYEPGSLFCCYWRLGSVRIRQRLAGPADELATPPDLFDMLEGVALRTTADLPAGVA